MDWFHCNHCFTRNGTKFAVSSCGHICCENCIISKKCSVCGSSCSYLPIRDEMKPHEKVFFKDPIKFIQSQQEHISQIAVFQQMQMDRIIAHFKHKAVELEMHLKEVTEHCYRQLTDLKRENAVLKKQLSELKRENAELKKPLSQRRVSPGQFQTEGQISSESQGWARERAPPFSSFTTPGSVASMSSHSSVHDRHRSPSSFGTPTRAQTPQLFHFQFMNGLSIHSPRP